MSGTLSSKELAIAALEHVLKVFRSMADRGAYPAELLPTDDDGKDSSLYLGKQGFMFAIDAIRALRADNELAEESYADMVYQKVTEMASALPGLSKEECGTLIERAMDRFCGGAAQAPLQDQPMGYILKRKTDGLDFGFFSADAAADESREEFDFMPLYTRAIQQPLQLPLGNTSKLPNEAIRALTLATGGEFHGPNIEHASIEEQLYYRLMRQAFELGRRATQPLSMETNPVAWRMPYDRTEGWLFSETAPNDPAPNKWEPLYTHSYNNDWEENAQYLLNRCPYTIRVCEGGGPENLLHSFIHTFTNMEHKLEKNSHPEYQYTIFGWVTPDGEFTTDGDGLAGATTVYSRSAKRKIP